MIKFSVIVKPEWYKDVPREVLDPSQYFIVLGTIEHSFLLLDEDTSFIFEMYPRKCLFNKMEKEK